MIRFGIVLGGFWALGCLLLGTIVATNVFWLYAVIGAVGFAVFYGLGRLLHWAMSGE